MYQSLKKSFKPQLSHQRPLKALLLPSLTAWGMRNELQPKRLFLAQEMAKACPDKNFLGTFENKAEYAKAQALFLASTTEARTAGYFLDRYIIPKLVRCDSLLDVGIGNGQLTKWIASKFAKDITINDTDPKFTEQFIVENKHLANKKQVITKTEPIQSLDIAQNSYDLCVLSHVLYYIEKKEWLQVITKLYNGLRPNGCLFIAMSGLNDQKESLLHYFGSKRVNVEHLYDICQSHFINSTTIYETTDRVIANDSATMSQLIGFLLNDVGSLVSKQRIMKYAEKLLKQDNLYQLKTKQSFFVISKPDENAH